MSESPFLATVTGMRATRQFWAELKAVLEKESPGCTNVLRSIDDA